MPDTTSYLYLGLAVVFVLMGGFIGSLWMRFRNLQKDMKLIEQLKEDN